jgi:hypothetical protein
MKAARMFAVGIIVIASSSLIARGAEATGFTLTEACGIPPFAPGVTDMHLHLRHFPEQKSGQELVLDMPSLLGPSGDTDWIDVPAHLCAISSTNSCSDARSARVQVLHYSGRYYPFIRNWFTKPRIFGNFEVNLKDGNSIKGSLNATAHKLKYPQQPICE